MNASSLSLRWPLFVCLAALAGGAMWSGCSCDSSGSQRDGSLPDADLSDGDLPDLFIPLGCGDGTRAVSEACDDGNTVSNDGCSFNCGAVEEDFLCPVPGRACVRVVTCGNRRIEGPETCDDGDAVPGDGCSARCRLEAGWTCPTVGATCVAAECGDGIVAGFEACDDGNNAAPGCSATCQLEEGFACPTPNAPCEATECGDGVVEGTEECDDGDPEVGDGCDPFCKREPDCSGGVCVAVCGDGTRWSPEACDDGNTVSGDGCSADCSTVETGFTCVETPLPPPSSVSVPITYRDFRHACGSGAALRQGQMGAIAPFGHPDFQCFLGVETGIVTTTLDADGKPVYNAARSPLAATVTDASSFSTWYRTDSNFNRAYGGAIELPRLGATGAVYRFESFAFFPLTGNGLDTVMCGPALCESLYGGRNFYFTSEVRFWFEYSGTEVLDFFGDDDVWVFIDGQLVVDIGGVHGALPSSINIAACNNANPDNNAASCISDLNLTVGGIYEAAVFHAERAQVESGYRLTLTNFNQAPSQCRDMCGDQLVSPREACDLGAMNGSGDGSPYGGCTTSCTFESYCGDGVVDSAFGEICDDGVNLGAGSSSCAPGCQSMGARCGDGVVQTDFDEECDDGNTVVNDGCSSCRIEFG